MNVGPVLFVAAALTGCQGCAVLTKSQVQEVNAFAGAAEAYGTLPGEPVRLHAEADRMDRIVNVSTRNFTDADAREEGWNELKKANEFSNALREVAGKADGALEVYAAYAHLLQAVCSNEYTDSLQASAKSLGQKVDKAVASYNKLVREPAGKADLDVVGGMAAAVARAGGGLYIRHQQARILKYAITSAQPVLAGMTGEMRALMSLEASELTDLENRLQGDFKTAAGRFGRVSMDMLVAVADTRRKLDTARELCGRATAAADLFEAAHTKLAENVRQRQALKQSIAEIQALAEEIKQAQKLKKELEK